MRGDRRLLFFGDSHVAGVGDPTGRGWVGRVLASAFASGMTVTAHNLGVRGETSVQVAARFRREAQLRLPDGAQAGAVLSFGVNDTTLRAGQGRVTAERSREALGCVLDEAARIELPVLVVGPAPVADAAQNRRIEKLSGFFAEVCTDRGTPFIGVFDPLLASHAWMAEVGMDDGAHPRAQGYDALAQLVLAGGLLDWFRRHA